MVVMHVGQNHIGDGVAVEPDQCQRLCRAPQVPPPSRRGDLGGKPGVDHNAALAPDRRPDVVIHRHWPVMRVAPDKVIGAPGVALSIADGIELVFGEMAVHGETLAWSTGMNGKDCGGATAVQA